MDPKPTLIALMGPTAAGKTDLALSLAEQLGGEIISVDSALVYKGMNLGTAKPTAAERARVPHHLIDLCDPAESYSAADFCLDAHAAIVDILTRGKRPILVGGTMLYFKALLDGLSDMPASTAEVRAQVEREAELKGWPALHAELAQVDPICAQRLHPNHSARIGRALEVYRMSGIPMSQWQSGSSGGLWAQYNWCQIAIAPKQRSLLHERIAQRFDAMLAGGLIEEVAGLKARPDLHPALPSMRAVGYRQVWQYLAGECDVTQMRAAGIAATRQLAKRQFTWLKGWHDLSWVYTQADDGSLLGSEEILIKTLQLLASAPI
ncbi:MAG TPA: tRNA (adenosine(37)-N6)-dimethylallyltransferase MiaA [Cellvibrionaceae bacterium]|nr:tRNA (adenosine(37)-N6)-dimethylallyltransferase MiaA [Cellvibrionaceae bacterium]